MEKYKPYNWEIVRLDEVLYYEQPTSYIVSSTDYKDTYPTPVLTAGKSFIIGCTNEKDGIYTDLPCIIFDDFTTESKYVNFPFKVKSSAMKILTNNSNTNLKYLFFVMQTIDRISDLHKRFWISDYSNKFIFLPPLAEQQRIVERVEELFAQIDIIDENQADIEALYDELKKRTLDLAIQGKLVPQDENDEPASVLLEKIRAEKKAKLGKKYVDSYIYKGDDNCYYEHLDGINEDKAIEVPFELPNNWAWGRLKDVALTQTGTTPKTTNKDNFGDFIPFIKPGDITDGKINYNNEGLSVKGLSSGRLINQKSVLMVCIGGSLGKCALCDRDVSCNQQINTATPPMYLNAKYLYYCLSSDYFYKVAKEQASGTATPIINRSLWESIIIPISPLAEQQRIVDRINEIFAKL